MPRVLLVAAALAVCLGAPAAQVDEKKQSLTIAFVGARIHTAAGATIDDGVLLVREGKILAVGPRDKVAIPNGAIVRDMAGKVIIPGLVDTHSHIGVASRPSVSANQDGNEMTGPVQPGLRALDALNPHDPGIRMALAGGVTTVNIMPGSGNVIGGQTIYVKLRGGIADMMRVLAEIVVGGIKFANGENPKGAYGGKGQAPGTRMKVMALQREALTKARTYQKKWDDYRKATAAGKEATAPERDLALEPLVEVLERKRTVHFHCHRADDILSAVRLAQEFNFELVLQHCTEGYRVADILAKLKIPVSLTLVDSPGGKPEVMGLLEENAAILQKAGVLVAINTDDAITESRFLLRTGAIAVRGGMSEDDALKALTINGAKIMHLDHRLGSLEAGKDADFVVLSGAPFSVYTQVLETYIEGEKMFDRSRHEDWCYQGGGFALADRQLVPKAVPALKALPRVEAPKFEPHPHLDGAADSYVIFAKRVHTVANGTIEDAAIVVEKGKIKTVGSRKDVRVPAGMPALSAAVVTPGLIDAHSVVGLSGALNFKKADQDQDETSDPNQAELRVLDGFNPAEPLLQFIREQGVTVVHAMPGRANVLAGQTGIFRTHGRTAEQMTVRFPAGVLVNLGEVPKGAYSGRLPSTRMGTANLVRTALQKAENYAGKKKGGKDVDPDLKSEALRPALTGDIAVVFSAHRADDLSTALRLADEFKIKPILSLATEGYLLADTLEKRRTPVIVHPTMQRPASLETYNGILGNAAVLAEHQVPIAISTAFEGYVPKTRVLRYEAAMAMVNGLGFERALRAITLDAARILKIDDRFGSIAPGKTADLVLYDGDPFEHTTHVMQTIIDGRVIYDRTEYLKLPFERRVLPFIGGGDFGCCLSEW
jgi:imidazolonepropionase-like amidohydrolase